MRRRIKIVMALLGVMYFSLSSLSLAAAGDKKADILKCQGKITALNAAPPVNGKIGDIQVSVTDDAGKKNIFVVRAATRVVDKAENKPEKAVISPGRNVVVKYEVRDGANYARVIKLLE